MSANNWTLCPRCMKSVEARKAEDKASVEDAYGVIPSEEYAKRREEAHEDIELDCTMREDYALGMNLLGEFTISFSASCSNCGFHFLYEDKRQATL